MPRGGRPARFYGRFIGPGDLCFDVGAHVGDRARCWSRLGARVVAVEPQPDFAGWLRFLFRRNPAVTVIEAALGRAPGRAELRISRRTPTVTTLSDEWRRAVAPTAGFRGVAWAESTPVSVTTLDELIARFGRPGFCKIDVEGFEAEVLGGLSTPLPALSIEYLPAARAVALRALDELDRLGRYRFNVARGETARWLLPAWVDGAAIRDWLTAQTERDGSGDLYAWHADRALP